MLDEIFEESPLRSVQIFFELSVCFCDFFLLGHMTDMIITHGLIQVNHAQRHFIIYLSLRVKEVIEISHESILIEIGIFFYLGFEKCEGVVVSIQNRESNFIDFQESVLENI
eukprot:TRINITY_DN41119_c0_g1_i1.p1 TRINITY_DN41119_c0_g1~~TRINITY_DN41119_c0_g1_i1.p1  ORF type:complete len:112 (-),score=9.97 TRINITY_DN41119_c0_g1_i1:358-693(-)